MRDATLRQRAAQAAFLGALLLAGVVALSQTEALAQPKTKAPPKDTKTKTPPALTKLNLTIVPPKAGDSINDVVEVSKTINDKIEAGWKANKITPSAYSDDYEFARRASLDIIGRIARPSEIKDQYMKWPADKRRSMWINYLLKHEDYARHWANLWTNWLLTRAGDFGRGKYHDQMSTWLEDQFAQNKSYSEITTKLITATGKNTENGAVNFMLAHLGEPIPAGKRDEEGQFEMVPLTSRITRVFLGTQVQCAQCHAHPFFNALKQESFWGVNAFLRQIRQEGAPMRRPARMALPDLTLSDNPAWNKDASVFYELRNGKIKQMSAEFLAPAGKDRGPKLDPKKTGVARREELAKYLIEHDMFSKAIVNRMWGLFMGRGFVNPIDDFNDNNAPSHPELLNELAARFKHYDYDMKKLIRWITHSNAYHLGHVANATNDKPEHETQFSRMLLKSLSPEQMFESLMTATQADKSTNAAEKKTMRDQWLSQLITNFGDDEGNEVTFNGTIVQALLMMNGKNINDAITAGKGTVATVTSPSTKTPAAVINDLYMAALNRPPRPAELKSVMDKISLRAGFSSKDTPKARYEDLFWALLNSNEFLLNH